MTKRGQDRLSGRIATFWRSPRGNAIMPICCAAYEVMLFTRMMFVPSSDNESWRNRLPTSSTVTFMLLLAIIAVSVVVLLFRRSRPLAVLLCECALIALTAVLWRGTEVPVWFIVAVLCALYDCVLLEPVVRAAIGGIVTILVVMSANLFSLGTDASPSRRFDMLYPMGVALAAVIGAAAWSRSLARQRSAMLAERQRSQRLAAQRDIERRRSRIAAELHDSVGHNLTAIIALTEGLQVAAQGDETTAQAAASVNELAREALAKTRQAVGALDTLDDADRDMFGASATWDDIQPVLAHARASGIAAALAETGLRADDARQADLCLRISREAVTNTMRHARQANRIVVSWDHHEDGSLTVTVRDNGGVDHTGDIGGTAGRTADTYARNTLAGDAIATADGAAGEWTNGGSGVARLRAAVTAIGGTFDAGPDAESDGWCVRAWLPAAGTGTDGKER